MEKETPKKSDTQWKKTLSPMQYHVLREAGTERAFTGAYWDEFDPGKYYCAGCQQLLFDAGTKYDAGCGWPSFSKTITNDAITVSADNSHGIVRQEVRCSNCNGHLGHVFEDGPAPTGLRYCMNSAALTFEEEKKSKD